MKFYSNCSEIISFDGDGGFESEWYIVWDNNWGFTGHYPWSFLAMLDGTAKGFGYIGRFRHHRCIPNAETPISRRLARHIMCQGRCAM